MIIPNSTLGMLGGGQLGRLFTVAAREMGYRVIVLEPDPHSPAGQVADEHIIAAYDDEVALTDFAKRCEVITTEFENVPAQSLECLLQHTQVHPNPQAIAKTQDRNVEKNFIRSCGLLTTPFRKINTQDDINALPEAFGFPAILKTARFGYDGKGQITVNQREDLADAFEELQQQPCVLEQRVDLECEISVVLGRNSRGESAPFPVSENDHRNGILHQSIVPARVDQHLANSAQAAAKRIADKLDFVGIIAVEFFVSKQGELLVNEIAPRTHNSGHYTIDACATSQFEQQIRMICDLPIANTSLLSPVVMVNLLGDVWQNNKVEWDKILRSPSTKLHLYGKKEARPGRKMGHFSCLASSAESALRESDQLFQQLHHQ